MAGDAEDREGWQRGGAGTKRGVGQDHTATNVTNWSLQITLYKSLSMLWCEVSLTKHRLNDMCRPVHAQAQNELSSFVIFTRFMYSDAFCPTANAAFYSWPVMYKPYIPTVTNQLLDTCGCHSWPTDLPNDYVYLHKKVWFVGRATDYTGARLVELRVISICDLNPLQADIIATGWTDLTLLSHFSNKDNKT